MTLRGSGWDEGPEGSHVVDRGVWIGDWENGQTGSGQPVRHNNTGFRVARTLSP
jgi:hypothetical protein